MKKFKIKCTHQSPVQDDYNRVVKIDELGNEITMYEKVDYAKVQEALGSWKSWSLDYLLKAGINPDFPIHTGMNTRLEGAAIIEDMAAEADRILAGVNEENNNF